MLAQHWGITSNAEPPKSDPAVKIEGFARSQSIDVAGMNRAQANGTSGPSAPPAIQTNGPRHSPSLPQRTASTPVIPSIHTPIPPSRTNSVQADPRRPRLKVQIPNEDSGDERATGDTSPQATAAAQMTPIREGHAGVVLPPPSPSAGALLSAGATGPPNPFARPAPPPVNGRYDRNDLETPISALPSRFVSDQLLPSPSSFYADWGFGRNDNNMLPSPLAFPTPVAANGQGFREDEADKKRKLTDGGENTTPEKRLKT